jgi:hypothetical protein
MIYQQSKLTTIEEVNLNRYVDEDSKADDTIVNTEAGDVPGDESLSKVCAKGLNV